jgi:peptidoglycan/xylan/chitin deacetylase (PgdA/CDA1 family)
MNYLNWGRSAVFHADHGLAEIYLRVFRERKSLIIFLFHSLVVNETENCRHLIEPKRLVSRARFRQFIDYFLEQGYQFVSPADISNGNLSHDKKYALITFDDGYANNLIAPEILKAYGVPAVFFIATNFVLENKCFWWDVVSRERLGQSVSAKKILSEKAFLKTKTHEAIEHYLREAFGAAALTPRGDLDRPLSPKELQALSKETSVILGNHTRDHAILPNYSEEEIESQIAGAQETLWELTGVRPLIISYPDGRYSTEVLGVTRRLGIPLGVTTDYGKNSVPLGLHPDSSLRLKRCGLWDNRDPRKSCAILRSDISFYKLFKSFS